MLVLDLVLTLFSTELLPRGDSFQKVSSLVFEDVLQTERDSKNHYTKIQGLNCETYKMFIGIIPA